MSRSIKYLLGALGLLLMGIVVSAAQPIWVTPPWMRLTSIIYSLILLTWIPPFFYGLWRLLRGRRSLLISVMFTIFVGQCCLTLAPAELGYLGMYNGVHPVLGGSFTCRKTGAQALTCELCIVSSDNPPETLKTYHFKTFGALPVMQLTGSGTEHFDTWHTPPCKQEH